MGLLSWLTGANAGENLDDLLLRDYTALFKATGMNHQEAANQAASLIEAAKKAVVEWGWDRLPPRYGDSFLEQAQSNAKDRATLERLRSDGVRDEDIQLWWNMPPLERAAIEKVHELNCLAKFMELVRGGDSATVAGLKVRKIQPQFGDSTNTSSVTGAGDDRPIPWELQRRITIFGEKHYHVLNELRRMTEESTSFNALVRQQIRLGKL